MCHRSWVAESLDDEVSNERLEFLGDAVLGWVIADIVFRSFSQLAEGALTDLRKSVVNANALAEVAGDLELGSHLLLGRGEDAAGGREKTSILSDAMEAVLGAVYLDGGQACARSADRAAVRAPARRCCRLAAPARLQVGAPGAARPRRQDAARLQGDARPAPITTRRSPPRSRCRGGRSDEGSAGRRRPLSRPPPPTPTSRSAPTSRPRAHPCQSSRRSRRSAVASNATSSDGTSATSRSAANAPFVAPRRLS